MSHFEYGQLSTYTSLADPGLAEYFQNKHVRKHLLRAGLVTRDGEIVSDNVYRMKNTKSEKDRFLQVRLLQAVVHKSLDMERTRQVEIRKKLEEISRIEMVQRIRAQERHSLTRDSLPMLNPNSRRVQSASMKRSENSKRRQSTEHDERGTADDEELVDVVKCRQRLRRKLGNDEIDSKHLTTLDSMGMREYGRVLEQRQRQPAYNPFKKSLGISQQDRKHKSSERQRNRSVSSRASPSPSSRASSKESPEKEQKNSSVNEKTSHYSSSSPVADRKHSRGKSHSNHNQDKEDQRSRSKLKDKGKEKKKTKPQKSPNRGYAELHRTEPALFSQSSFQSLCDIVMVYHGPKEEKDSKDNEEAKEGSEDASSSISDYSESMQPANTLFEIIIHQQPSGGNTLIVYRGHHAPGDTFEFVSRRHRNFPFGLAIYVNGVMNCRISTCCEYRHRMNARLGSKMGHFSIKSVKGAAPCFRCQVAKKSKPRKPKTPTETSSSSSSSSAPARSSSPTSSVHYSGESEGAEEQEKTESSKSDIAVVPIEDTESPRSSVIDHDEEERESPDFKEVSARTPLASEDEEIHSNPPTPRDISEQENVENDTKQVDLDDFGSASSPSRNNSPMPEEDRKMFLLGSELTIKNEKLSSTDIDNIEKDLSSAPVVEEIFIESTHVSPDDLERIFNSLSQPGKLRSLTLDDVSMTPKGAAVLEKFLPEWIGLADLVLDRNPLDDDGVHAIVQGLQKRHSSNDQSCEVLRRLSLSSTNMNKLSGNLICDLLNNEVPIRRLELSNNPKQSVEHWNAIGQGVGNNRVLEELAVDYCNMRTEDVNALVRYLNGKNNLQLLDLSGNDLDDDCVPQLCDAIRRCPKLNKVLCLTSNSQLSEESIRKIQSAERHHDDVSYLNNDSVHVEGESLNQSSFMELIRELKRGKLIEKIHVSTPNLTEQQFKELFFSIEYPSAIQILQISDLTMNEEKVVILTKFLLQCLQLEMLELTKVTISSRGISEVCSAMEERDKSADTDLQGLQSLHFYECKISDGHFPLVALQNRIITSNVSVKNLALTFIEPEDSSDWKQFIECVTRHKSLRSLDFHGSRMSLDMCATVLEQLAGSNARIQRIDLRNIVDKNYLQDIKRVILDLQVTFEVILD